MVAKRNGVFTSVLGQGIDHQAWVASLILELNGLTQELTPRSVAVAATNCAFLKLQFGKTLGQAYIVPFRNKAASQRQGRDIHDATLVVGYLGYIELGMRSKFLKDIHVDVVLNGEEFSYWKDETGPRLLHRPDLMERNPSRENITGAYVIYHTVDGGSGIRYVSRQEINKVDSNRDVWRSDFAAMCRKTAIRRAAQEWKRSTAVAHATFIEDQADREEAQAAPDGTVIDAEFEEAAYTLPTD